MRFRWNFIFIAYGCPTVPALFLKKTKRKNKTKQNKKFSSTELPLHFCQNSVSQVGILLSIKKNKKNYKIILSTDKLDKLGYMSKFLEKHVTKIDSGRNRKSE